LDFVDLFPRPSEINVDHRAVHLLWNPLQDVGYTLKMVPYVSGLAARKAVGS